MSIKIECFRYLVSEASCHKKKEYLVKYPEQNKAGGYQGRNCNDQAQQTA
jgi:hypothetical protein